jgi:hypothetical protein
MVVLGLELEPPSGELPENIANQAPECNLFRGEAQESIDRGCKKAKTPSFTEVIAAIQEAIRWLSMYFRIISTGAPSQDPAKSLGDHNLPL